MASFFGPITYQVRSGASEVAVRVELTESRLPRELVVHLRRPECQRIQTVTVNGRAHTDFDPVGEVVRVTALSGALAIQAEYASQ